MLEVPDAKRAMRAHIQCDIVRHKNVILTEIEYFIGESELTGLCGSEIIE
jgi:hypothetical protein